MEEKKNVRKTFFLLLIFFSLMLAFGLIVDRVVGIFPTFTLIFSTIALIQIFVTMVNGPSMILKSVEARQANPDDLEERQLINIVEELSIASGLPKPPKVYIIDNEHVANAFATGLKKEDSYVCVTKGLLKMMNREETEGVIAHELSHIRNRDTLIMTIIGSLIGAIVLIRIGAWGILRAMLWSGGTIYRRRKKDNASLPLIGILLLIIALSWIFSFLGKLTYLAVSRNREFLADATAVEITRNPNGLASALRKIAKNPIRLRNATSAVAHLFISDPLKRKINERKGFFSNLFATHPPIYERIAILEGRDPEEVRRELMG